MGLADAVAAVQIDPARALGAAGFLANQRRLPAPARPASIPSAKSLRTCTASAWLGCFGSGM